MLWSQCPELHSGHRLGWEQGPWGLPWCVDCGGSDWQCVMLQEQLSRTDVGMRERHFTCH